MGLSCTLMTELKNKVDELLLIDKYPKYIPLVIRDIARYRNKEYLHTQGPERPKQSVRGYMKVFFHNKGIEFTRDSKQQRDLRLNPNIF